MALRLYTALIHAARALAWPLLWWLGRRVPAFRERWDERRGRAPVPAAARGGIVVHAVSMGEVGAALPLVQALRTARPELPVIFTCTTPTASARIRAAFPPPEAPGEGASAAAGVHHLYLPFDTPGAVNRFLDAAAPRLLVVLETELWPHLLSAAQARGTAVVLANGRLSERSARRYAAFRGLTQSVLEALDLMLVQDEATRERFLRLGAAPARTVVTGSLKFDTPLPPDHAARVAQFRAWAGPRPLWVAASTHEGEEATMLAVQRRLHQSGVAGCPLLVLVPRHPQRFDAVASLLQASGLAWQRRSEGRPVEPDCAVLLADSMGELTAWMALADAVVMGGTLVPVGGHNPLEAMQFGVPLIAGPHVFNFAEVFAELEAADAVRRVDGESALFQVLDAWLADAAADPRPSPARELGERGRTVFARRGGATGRTLALVLDLMARRAGRSSAQVQGTRVWSDPAWWPQALAAPFDPSSGQAGRPGSGRGTVWFMQVGERQAVLRHYRRGGLVGRLVRDRYLREPWRDSRAMAEFALLQRLVSWRLPVPRAVAARWQPAGPLHYRADILVERLAGAEDLSIPLQRGPLSAAEWAAVGAAVARLHACGVHHSDLNCHNLMRDPRGRVWIIDFDRCEVRAIGPWRTDNLARLQRSLRKERGRLAAWHWSEADWSALQAGYDTAWAQACSGGAAPAGSAEGGPAPVGIA